MRVPTTAYPPTFWNHQQGVAVVGTDFRIQAVNDRFVESLAIERAAVIGRAIAELWALDADELSVLGARAVREGMAAVDAAAVDGSMLAGGTLQVLPLTEGERHVGFNLSVVTEAEKRENRAVALDSHGFEVSFDRIDVGMLITGVDGCIIRCNPAMQALLGRTADELAACDVLSLVHPDDRPVAIEQGYEVILGNSDGYQRERRVITGDGSIVWVHETTTCVRDVNRQPRYFVSQFLDIGDRKRAERERDDADLERRRMLAELTGALDALRKSEAKFKFLVEGTPVPLVEIDADRRISAANAELTKMLGLDPIGLAVTELVHPDDRERIATEMDEAQSADVVLEFRLRRPDRWIRAHTRLARDDGRVVSALATWHDITEAKRESDELRVRASTDALTGLANRTTFFAALDEALRDANGPNDVSVLFIDLDHFKPINDHWGHQTGDEVLCLVARRIGSCVRKDDLVARLGGDEFVVLLRDTDLDVGRAELGQRIIERVAEPIAIADATIHVSASIGLATGGVGSIAKELVDGADVAAYRAKRAGRSRLAVAS